MGTARTGKRGGLFGFHMTRGRGVSWGAAFAGWAVGTALQIALTLLGLAIGLAAVDDSAKAAGIGAAAWTLVAALISAWLGGRVAGAAAHARQRGDGAFHGILAWSLSTLIAVWLLTSGASRLLGGAAGLAGDVMGGATAGASQGAAMRPEQMRENVQDAAQNAQGQVNEEEARQDARRAADTAQDVATGAAWLALLGMGLTAAAAALGGASAARDDDDDDVVIVGRDAGGRARI